MKTTTVIPATLVFLIAAGSVQAQEEKPSFDKADANGDGKVSIEEATDVGIPEAEAKKEDLNNDDALTDKDWKYVEMNPEPTPSNGGASGGQAPGGGSGGGSQAPGGASGGGGQAPGGASGGGGQSGGGPGM